MCLSKDIKHTEKCHCIVELDQFGISELTGKGCIVDTEWVNSLIVPCYASKTDKNCIFSTPDRKIYAIEPMAKGKYGIIEGGLREYKNTKELIIIKKPQIHDNSMLKEALVQTVVYNSLQRRGFVNGAPKVYDIFSLPDKTVCFTMSILRGINLQHYIEKNIGFCLMNTLIECLFHVSSMIWHLEDDIGMNHRDLKPSNIILEFHDTHIEKKRTVGNRSVVITSRFDVCFIDFGFTCIGQTDAQGGRSLKMGKAYSPEDPCPKDGRDMYMFLCFIYFYTYRKLSLDIDNLFKKWLNVDGCIMTDFLKSAKTPQDTDDVLNWIYCVTGSPEVSRLKTSPELIFYDLQQLRSR